MSLQLRMYDAVIDVLDVLFNFRGPYCRIKGLQAFVLPRGIVLSELKNMIASILALIQKICK